MIENDRETKKKNTKNVCGGMLPGTNCLYKKASSVMSLRECHYPNFSLE